MGSKCSRSQACGEQIGLDRITYQADAVAATTAKENTMTHKFDSGTFEKGNKVICPACGIVRDASNGAYR